MYQRGDDPTYCLDTLCLEWSGIGKGDYRETPAEIKMPDGTFTADFATRAMRSMPGSGADGDAFPRRYGGADDCETLLITMLDESNQRNADCSYYTVYPQADVIARRAVLENGNEAPLTIRRLLSMMVDLPNDRLPTDHARRWLD